MIDLTQHPIDVTRALVDIESVSKNEKNIADVIEAALRNVATLSSGACPITVERFHNTVMAKTDRGLPSRVVLAGHVDTVPIADNLPCTRGTDLEGRDTLFGCGTVDMKSGDAVFLHAFACLAASPDLARDMTLIMYEAEEIAASENGLRKLAEHSPEWLQGDVAILGEPSGAVIEAGCQGSVRVKVTAVGERAHSARSWLGDNAMHKLAPVMTRVADYDGDKVVEVDGLEYREGFNIVMCESGVATNTIPDEAWMFVNYRFAPGKSTTEAVEETFAILGVGTPDHPVPGFRIEIDDESPAALPGLHQAAAAELVDVMGGHVRPKYGWTDVARFAAMGIPAVNFGPGDPSFAHKKDEQCPVDMISEVSERILAYLRNE
ncbi:succinyl-diaminopimelate desuccinylase [Corynebacterium kroppenstedtii]|uniref:succinyl-diaminopimelate desuccinylase n=1 Tax=Corynebacterium sp. PCR 32 TaxID=3351342 RepID=UPI0030B77213